MGRYGGLKGWWRRTSLMLRLVMLALIPTALTALLLVALLAHQQFRAIAELARSTGESIAAQTAVIAAEPLALNDRRELNRIAHAVSRLPHVSRVSFGLPDGEILVDAPTTAGKPGLKPLRVQRDVFDGAGNRVGTLRLELSRQDAIAMQRNGLLVAALWLVVAMILAGLLSWQVARWIGRPLHELAVAVGELGRGDHAVSVAVTDEAEIGNLQRAFNAAAVARIETRRDLQQRVEAATTELAHKNAELEAANVAKARFLAAATHDLRQPLCALTLISSALAAGETDPLRLERIARMQECTDSLDGLFSELLDLSRLETGAMQPEWKTVALDEVFERVSLGFRMVAEHRELRLVIRKTDLVVRTDPTMLTRILSNLVSNALNYTERGGVLVGARRRGALARIDVWDTGVGIAEQYRQQVFEDFFRVERRHRRADDAGRGFGLGLATVQKLTRLLDSSIRLESRPGRGSLFTFEVRLACATDAPLPEPPKAVAPCKVNGMRVLVVDDDTTILSAMAYLLTGWGCEVRTGDNLEACVQAAAGWDRPPDIVISDLRLRDRVSGLDILAALDQRFGSASGGAPFARILMTGETRVDRLREVVAARIPVLYKPVAPEALRAAMVAACAAMHGPIVA